MSGADQQTPRARGPFLAQLRSALASRGYLERVDRRLSRVASRALAAPDPDAWVDESILVEVLEIARDVLGDETRWREMLRVECASGIQRFYRLFLRYATPNMLFLGLSRMWKMTHTTGAIAVRWRADHGGLVVDYLDHPPLASPVYQELTVAVLEALLALNRTRATIAPRAGVDPDRSFEIEVRLG